MMSFVLAACKVVIENPIGGGVQSESRTVICASGSVCELDVEDTFFEESFEPVAEPGYVFSHWGAGDRAFCGNSAENCFLSTKKGFGEGEPLESLLQSSEEFYLRPVFAESNAAGRGQIGGVNYAWFDFSRQYFTSFTLDFVIHNEPSNQDGLYYQFYQGFINGIAFYFGIQTHVYNPAAQPSRGLIFSRWETRDTENLREADNGWSQSAGYEGDFIGVRAPFSWKKGKYRVFLKMTDSDERGDWYGAWIAPFSDLSNRTYYGSLRFERDQHGKGIHNNGVAWTEVYFKDDENSPAPFWHVSITQALADGRPPSVITTTYNDYFFNASSYVDKRNRVHFLMGPGFNQDSPARRYLIPGD
jgi:hypothetical protein